MKKLNAFLAIILVTVFVISACDPRESESKSSGTSSNVSAADSGAATSKTQSSGDTSTDNSSSPNESLTSSTSKPDTSKPDENDIEGLVNWYYDIIFASEQYDKFEHEIADVFPNEFSALVALGEKAFPVLDDIIDNDGIDLIQRAFAHYIKYNIKPELYDLSFSSPDGKNSINCSVNNFITTMMMSGGNVLYWLQYDNIRLLNNTTNQIILTTDITDSNIKVKWRSDSKYAAISYGYDRYYTITDVFDIGNSKLIKLPDNKEIEKIAKDRLSVSLDNLMYYFNFEEWVSKDKIKINIYFKKDLSSVLYEGSYTYDLVKNEVIEFDVKRSITETKTFTFKLKDIMPEYKCVAKIDTENSAITDIIITEKDSGKAIQTIKPAENNIFTKSALYFMDVTFDGYADILIPIEKSSRRIYIGLYRWDNTKMQFVYQEDFKDLGFFNLDSAGKRILTHNFIWLDEGRNAEFYTILKFDGQKYVVENQFSITPSEDMKKAVIKETSGNTGSEVVVAEFELSLDENGGFDKNNAKIKPYYADGSTWDLDSDKWDSSLKNELK